MPLRGKELLGVKVNEKLYKESETNPKPEKRDKSLHPFKRPRSIVNRMIGEHVYYY